MRELSEIENYRIAPTDAGIETLEGGGRSAESYVVIFCELMYRCGSTRCRGYIIRRRFAEIKRVYRSPSGSERHADVASGDYSLRYRVSMMEFLTSQCEIGKLRTPVECPTLNPLSQHPADSHFKEDQLTPNIAILGNFARDSENDRHTYRSCSPPFRFGCGFSSNTVDHSALVARCAEVFITRSVIINRLL